MFFRGLISAYGSYQNYYENNILSSKSSTEISWIGTVQSVLVMLVGVASGPIFDRGYITSLLVVGSFLIIFGFMVLSLATQYYQILLAQGFCVGLGSGLIYTPGLALVATSFAKRRGLALALVTGGAPIGEGSGQCFEALSLIFYRWPDLPSRISEASTRIWLPMDNADPRISHAHLVPNRLFHYYPPIETF